MEWQWMELIPEKHFLEWNTISKIIRFLEKRYYSFIPEEHLFSMTGLVHKKKI